MVCEPCQLNICLIQAVAWHERCADIEKKPAQIFKCPLGILGNAVEQGLKRFFAHARAIGDIGHRRHLCLQELRVRRMSQQTPHQIQIEGACDGFAEKKSIGTRKGRICPIYAGFLFKLLDGQARQVMPRDMRHNIGRNMIAGQHIACLARIPESEIEKERPIPARSGRVRRGDPKAVTALNQHVF